MLSFVNDYSEGAHEQVLRRLAETNREQHPGYGTDPYCARAKEKIRRACGCPEGDIFFLVGGTQTNQAVISALLAPWEGVIAPATGHICTHEAGAIEATGHKVLELPQREGKLSAAELRTYLEGFYGTRTTNTWSFRAWCTCPDPPSWAPSIPGRSWGRSTRCAGNTRYRCTWTAPGWAMGWPAGGAA